MTRPCIDKGIHTNELVCSLNEIDFYRLQWPQVEDVSRVEDDNLEKVIVVYELSVLFSLYSLERCCWNRLKRDVLSVFRRMEEWSKVYPTLSFGPSRLKESSIFLRFAIDLFFQFCR